MANEQNLIPFTSEQSREEAKKNGQKGGIISGQRRRERTEWAKILDWFGQQKVRSKEQKKILTKAGIPEEMQTSDFAKCFVIDAKAKSGDPKFIDIEAKIRGLYAPTQNINENIELEPPAPRLAKDRSEKQ